MPCKNLLIFFFNLSISIASFNISKPNSNKYYLLNLKKMLIIRTMIFFPPPNGTIKWILTQKIFNDALLM